MKKIMIAALAGLAAGAVLGVLFAPGRGSETRKNISKAARNATSKLGDLKDKFSGANKNAKNRQGVGVENEFNEYVS